MSKEELDALKKLSNNQDKGCDVDSEPIMILKPDKGSGVLIMDTAEYIEKVNTIISDQTKFKLHTNQDLYKVSRSIEAKVCNYISEHLKKPGLIDQNLYRKLYPNGSHIGVLYGLPKVHKPGSPVRPICSAVGTSTYELSKYVAQLIRPASLNKFGTDLKDTFQFVNQIKTVDMGGSVMVSLDVRSLFTNVPLYETIDICLDRLYRSDNPGMAPSIPEHVLRRLIELCVCDNLFVFNGKVYAQTDGVAMGNSIGPILANIFMCHLEEKYMLQSELKPSFYRRYVDDTFCLFDSIEQAQEFLLYINSLHPSIQFDMEIECDSKLAFLDTIVDKANLSYSGNPSISTKVKPTDKGLFYNFSSYIPNAYKHNLVFVLVYRIYHIATDMSIFHTDVTSLTRRLVKNGFTKDFVSGIINKVLCKFHYKMDVSPPNNTGQQKKEVLFCIPYLGPMSYLLKRNITRLVHKFYPGVKIKVIFRRGFRIMDMFNRKDKFPLSCKSGVVYYIACRNCGPSQAYIGKTINSLYERFYQSGSGHLHANNADSALLKHINISGDPDCCFNFEDIKILDYCKYDERLRFIESVLLKYDRQNLNTQERSVKLNIV